MKRITKKIIEESNSKA